MELNLRVSVLCYCIRLKEEDSWSTAEVHSMLVISACVVWCKAQIPWKALRRPLLIFAHPVCLSKPELLTTNSKLWFVASHGPYVGGQEVCREEPGDVGTPGSLRMPCGHCSCAVPSWKLWPREPCAENTHIFQLLTAPWLIFLNHLWKILFSCSTGPLWKHLGSIGGGGAPRRKKPASCVYAMYAYRYCSQISRVYWIKVCIYQRCHSRLETFQVVLI